MEILKRGTKIPPNKQVYVMKCRTCGCVFTYKEQNFEYIGADNTSCVACPQCNYYNFVPFFKKNIGEIKTNEL